MKIVVVCTGNRFRSPLAAALLRAPAERFGIEVESCGTLELGAVPALPETLEAARALGVDLSEHRARSLAQAGAGDADLLLGFERIHVAQARLDAGVRKEVAFTLPELVQLLERIERPGGDDPVVRARTALERAHALREVERRPAPELADPLGRPPKEQRRIAEAVATQTAALARLLFG